MLSQLVEPDARVYVLMWYQVLGFVGTSVGALASGLIITQLERTGWKQVQAYRVVFMVYAVAAAIKMVLSLAMTSFAELNRPPKSAPQTQQPATSENERQPLLSGQQPSVTESILSPPEEPATPLARLPLGKLVALCLIFSLDSFASSLIPNSFIAYYFRLSFNAPLSAITRTFSAGSLIAGFSQLAAGSIARRLGIILTMVGTHSEWKAKPRKEERLADACTRSSRSALHYRSRIRTFTRHWTHALPRPREHCFHGHFSSR